MPRPPPPPAVSSVRRWIPQSQGQSKKVPLHCKSDGMSFVRKDVMLVVSEYFEIENHHGVVVVVVVVIAPLGVAAQGQMRWWNCKNNSSATGPMWGEVFWIRTWVLGV